VALIVYDNVVTADTIAAVDNSRSAKIFARTTDNLDNQIPEDAPGWIVARYEELVSTCTTPATSE
jgi:membrane protein required for colicin V production